ncbi:MAG: DUF1566 domain-containing protein [Magnetococcales bacterium]|nr:DUF1566 domain-containing protein [Magnetococcales bacterium]
MEATSGTLCRVVGMCLLASGWGIPDGWADDPGAPLSKTGQTTRYRAGDDGQLEKGVAWPAPRFTDHGNGTVTDHLTQLVWMKNANCWPRQNWDNTLNAVAALNAGSQSCSGYTTGTHSDWRVPNIDEMQSLFDYGRAAKLSTGHPFTAVQNSIYWSSTTYAGSTSSAWNLSFNNGAVGTSTKTGINYVWPVRGGP